MIAAVTAQAGDGSLDPQSALVYALVVIVVAVVGNLWLRRHVPRGRPRRSKDGVDPSRSDADGSDPGRTPPDRERGPYLG